jgi:SSS family solute:Na+ symporter
MELSVFDIVFFCGFIAAVVLFAMYKSRRERSSEDYFLASRGLTWYLIGLSIVAANISTEQLVGMAGQSAGAVGLAVSAWQLTGSVGIVIIAFTLLPRFLRAGIYTMPEYLEYRYNPAARAIMAAYMMVIYVAVTITAVLYSGGLALQTIFGMELAWGVVLIGAIAALYTTWGGLKAVAWADLFLGAALLIGGILTMTLGFRETGGPGAFFSANRDRLHMILPADNDLLPWTGVVLGMWIPIVYYCGLNQFIVQRTLAARSLKHGQLGVVFAAALWLLVPFAIVLPGIMAVELYGHELAREADEQNEPVLTAFEEAGEGGALVLYTADGAWKDRYPDRWASLDRHNQAVEARAAAAGATPETASLIGYKYDAAFPLLIKRLIPPGLRGLMFAAIAGAVISSLASMLNSASTIFTMDLYRRHLNRSASQANLVWTGRLMTLCFVGLGCLLAPELDRPRFKGVFNFIQEFQGYISPGVVAVFLVGFLVKRAPPVGGVVALLISGPVYGLLHWQLGWVHFLIRMMITFCALVIVMVVIRLYCPLAEPRTMPVREGVDLENSPLAMKLGVLVIAGVVLFFILFW